MRDGQRSWIRVWDLKIQSLGQCKTSEGWRTRKPGVPQSMGSQSDTTEQLKWTGPATPAVTKHCHMGAANLCYHEVASATCFKGLWLSDEIATYLMNCLKASFPTLAWTFMTFFFRWHPRSRRKSLLFPSTISHICCCSVTHPCLTLRPHGLQTARQASLSITNSWSLFTHVHRGSDAIQPSHPLSSPSPPVFNLAQHQGLF